MKPQNRSHMFPLTLGWAVLLLGGCGAVASGVDNDAIPFLIANSAVGLGCILTSAVMAISGRDPE
ncbi:hypothetical protein [Planomonospora venezuelensis]|uniref:Lipoprotein n=1 Tax=Planomonospora venezuelensis TaxID=1999 RepID=A0A841D3D2_PLAVE|nr:hypothetical protein [Planomonospora venezuelensis]MBB5962675.1 hypothetical protein [Planomonospora venezuelensis]GIN01611.1 hypothetical protein Pve01_32690 [Planomonospora venezuelensis]